MGRAMVLVLYYRDLATDVPPQRELRAPLPNTFNPRNLYAESELSIRRFFVGRLAFFL